MKILRALITAKFSVLYDLILWGDMIVIAMSGGNLGRIMYDAVEISGAKV